MCVFLNWLNWLKGFLGKDFNVSVNSKKMSNNSGYLSGSKIKNTGNINIGSTKSKENK